jgi:hypothetical protein
MVHVQVIFLSSKTSNQLWYPPSLLFNGYWSSFPGYCRLGIKFTTHLHLVLKLQMSGATPLLPLHAFPAWTMTTTFPFLFLCLLAYLNSEPTSNLIRSHMLLAGHAILSIKIHNRNKVCPHCQWSIDPQPINYWK